MTFSLTTRPKEGPTSRPRTIYLIHNMGPAKGSGISSPTIDPREELTVKAHLLFERLACLHPAPLGSQRTGLANPFTGRILSNKKLCAWESDYPVVLQTRAQRSRNARTPSTLYGGKGHPRPNNQHPPMVNFKTAPKSPTTEPLTKSFSTKRDPTRPHRDGVPKQAPMSLRNLHETTEETTRTILELTVSGFSSTPTHIRLPFRSFLINGFFTNSTWQARRLSEALLPVADRTYCTCSLCLCRTKTFGKKSRKNGENGGPVLDLG